MDTQTTAPQTTADRTQGQEQDAAGAVKSVAATASQEAGRTTREATEQARQLLVPDPYRAHRPGRHPAGPGRQRAQ